MDARHRIEVALRRAAELISGPATPPGLRRALEHALFGGGGRVRPWLTLAVAAACSEGNPRVAEGAAAAIEMLHCASLVHDDLPCFDDAPVRRGRPSVQAAFGEQLAVLVGDGLIVGAFDVLATSCQGSENLVIPLLRELSDGVGMARGIVAGQAWESESAIDLRAYHRSKTGALFVAAVRAGALAGGGQADPWTALGQHLGEAYQVADDIYDVVGRSSELGKPTGQDALLGRPSAVQELGMIGAYKRLDALMGQMLDEIPACPGEQRLRRGLVRLLGRVFPALQTDPTGSYPAVQGSTGARVG